MKPKSRYTSREQIVAEIDKWEQRVNSYMSRASKLYQSAEDMRVEARKTKSNERCCRLLISAKTTDAEGDKKVEYAARLRGGKLNQLSNKLSEFDTMVLPGMGTDTSVEGL